MKIRIRYTWAELCEGMASSLRSLFLDGLFCLLWSVAMLVANAVMWCAGKAASAIRRKPVAAVGVTIGVAVVATAAVYMQMKTRLTTAEWQRDSLELRLDSLCEAYGINPTYTRTAHFRRGEALP